MFYSWHAVIINFTPIKSSQLITIAHLFYMKSQFDLNSWINSMYNVLINLPTATFGENFKLVDITYTIWIIYLTILDLLAIISKLIQYLLHSSSLAPKCTTDKQTY